MHIAHEKMILDATASNQTMYETKQHDNIIFLDIERKLERKLDILADDRCLPFQENSLHTILFDPPYYWTTGKPDFYGIPDAKTFNSTWFENRKFPRYYGTDKYQTRSQLIKYLCQTLHEFKRVLTFNGLLWVKWCESILSLNRFLALFNEYELLLKIEVKDKAQTQGNQQTYWLCFIPRHFVEHLLGVVGVE